MVRRLLILVGSVVAALALAAGPAAAAQPSASPSPEPPVTFVEITGDDLDARIVLSSERHPHRERAMRAEVEWLAGKTPFAAPPEAGKLGPKYTVVLLTMGQATHRFDLYPLADGGPRVFRPAEQPDGSKVAEGWFYGRLSMPSTLVSAGVPIEGATPDPGVGGQGGGAEAAQAPDIPEMLGDWRRFMTLNTAAVIIIAAGVFALAYMLRRRI